MATSKEYIVWLITYDNLSYVEDGCLPLLRAMS